MKITKTFSNKFKFVCIRCKKCKHFFFNNQLHRHLRRKCQNQSKFSTLKIEINKISTKKIWKKSMINFELFSILIFSVDFSRNIKIDFEFRNYQYATTRLSFSTNVSEKFKCLNIETILIIIDKKKFLFQFKKSIRTMITKIIVCEIDANKHRIKKYVTISIFFRKTNSHH